MARRSTDLGSAELGAIRQAARKLGKDASKNWRDAVRKAGAPMVADAKARFRALGGTGRRTARSVALRQANDGVTIKMGGAAYPFARGREFGAKGAKTFQVSQGNLFGRGITFEGSRTIDYSSPKIFGSWTGSSSGASGRAFYPAIRKHLGATRKRLEALADNYIDVLAKAAQTKGG